MEIEVPSLLILNGAQGAGKSYAIKYIMHKLRKTFKYGLVFTNTFFDDNPFDYIPSEYIHPEYDEDILNNLMNIQKDLIEKDIVNEAFVIFDDCMDDPNQFQSTALKRLTTQLRHYHITVIFSTQYANHLPPRMRTNAMAVIIFQTDTKVSLEALYNSYGQHFESFKEFKKFLMKNIGNHKFVYYKKNSKEKDKYQVMIAPKDIPNFHIKY